MQDQALRPQPLFGPGPTHQELVTPQIGNRAKPSQRLTPSRESRASCERPEHLGREPFNSQHRDAANVAIPDGLHPRVVGG